MAGDEHARRTSHTVTVEATHIYRGQADPSTAEFLTQDGVGFDRVVNQESTGQGVPLEFYREKKRTYECSCGKRFRKAKTAREHLEEFKNAE